ncbi:L-type lectin-domain containing receptor kinase SIT2-like isoform X1 [Panicum virgatum]|uniref:L-type lectin-domain containing receptor kinase SIT2-like isoform X1 n=1 Tax=Panicum virgatum TaxID=38727 RepID=UPI0019D66E2F|nr:L-type lectin-domain containing receptor kinase SIT2-like isoform X1 [Panicum virgatum]
MSYSYMNPLFFLLILHLFFIHLNLSAFGIGRDQFVYSGFTSANLTLDGAATITPNGLLELTNGTVRLKGHAFHPTPIHISKEPHGTVQSFALSFIFAIYCVQPDICGHGIAFLVAAHKNFSNTMPMQYMGLISEHSNGNATNHFFAVELDTNCNDEFKDIENNHVGIDINGLNSANSSSAGYNDNRNGNFHNLTLASYKVMQVWVEYDEDNTQINVTLSPVNVAKPFKPLLSTTYNLSRVLRDKAYVGFSSSTGTIVILLVRRWLMYAELREDWEVEFGPHRFSYKDLFYATEGFKNKNLLGIGGFGRVYKGVLPKSKVMVAVKKISHNSKQGMKEFVAEVVSIGRLQHRNLVQLHGYCRRKGELILVYEYMPGGSLDRYLYDQENKPTLNWDQRMRIIKGIASGLLYLHEEWEKVVLHRDIKPSNVLLDDEMNAHLGDFGLARLYDHGAEPQTTHIVGTIGYLAPELGRTSKATPLTDVFSFGMFVLEITCGRKPIEQTGQDRQLLLVDWVLDCWHKGLVTDAVDVKLQGAYNVDEACLILKMGLLCSHPFINLRPSMREVMQYLNGNVPLQDKLTPADMSLSMLSFMQNRCFNPATLRNSFSTTNNSMISYLTGGR